MAASLLFSFIILDNISHPTKPFSLYPNCYAFLYVLLIYVHFCQLLYTFIIFCTLLFLKMYTFVQKYPLFCTVHTFGRVNLEISSVFLFFSHSIILSLDFFLCLFRFSVFFTNRYKGLKIFPFLIFSSLSSGWFWALEANMSSFYLSVFVFFFCSSLFFFTPPQPPYSLSLPFCPLFYAYGNMCASFRERVVLSHNKCIKNALGRHQIRHSSHLYFSLFRKETFIKVNIGYYVGKISVHDKRQKIVHLIIVQINRAKNRIKRLSNTHY